MAAMSPTFEYDPSADALLIKIRPASQISRTVEVDDSRFIDLDSEGRVVEIEVLWASTGVRVEDLIDQFDLGDFQGFLEEIAALDFRPRSFA